jgi:hypothetical protein
MLEGLINKLEKIRDDLPKEAEKIAIKQKDRILDYIREKQLFSEGVDGDGNILGTYSSTYDGNGKGYPKIKGTRYNFFDTGGLTAKMDLIFTDQHVIGVFSIDDKYPVLIEDHPSMFSFTERNREKIDKEIFETNLVKWSIKKINSIKI